MNQKILTPGKDGRAVGMGDCCSCGANNTAVRNVVMLPYRHAKVAGAGWGCRLCNLKSDGAIAVLCDGCASRDAVPKSFCVGRPGDNVRAPIAELTESYTHNRYLHFAFGKRPT